MSLQVTDLLAPSGLIESSFFDDDDSLALEERLQAWMNEAARLGSPSDEATRAYAYHRAFFAKYLQISTNPESTSMDEQGSALYHSNQASRFLDLSREWETKWNLFLASGVPGRNVFTTSVKNVFGW